MTFRFFLVAIILNLPLATPVIYFDLSHTFDPSIPFFPTQVRFNFTQRMVQLMNEKNKFFYATNAFITISVHARIVDVSKQCSQDRNYLITIDDVKNSNLFVPETDTETGEKFSFVLIFYTGWAKYWPDQTAYAGDKSDLHFPGLSEQLATYLVNTYGDKFIGVGIDTLSTDYGQSKTYVVHQILARHNKYGLENLALTNNFVNSVQTKFFPLDVYPMKIGNGTGAPCRIVARLNNPKRISK
ncbi:unnamed protein product [Adineta ricciae]|uniref:Uncharacterized protein n=1 Tax=Adineta ricciae TaxID=249248 RepID=A0A814RUA9_ADIRI|nr:unnamed protein product [Adineta ricciae]